ncbi:MAG: hypothetical protein KKF48_03065 [Nanoarchaeota archaeon]|nr:hypothetical protein [Nanoarchaeota archaeon]MBU1028004.1 hypothetical protein [Nanoarchaeota archaeon]
MKLLGFNFTKISIEKKDTRVDKLKINTKIDLKEIKEVEQGLFKTKEKLIAINFNYSIEYEPEFAKIYFEGGFVISLESKDAKELLKQWEEKKTPDDIRIKIFNIILRKTNVKALQLEEEIGLPFHVSMPIIRKQDPTNQNTET